MQDGAAYKKPEESRRWEPRPSRPQAAFPVGQNGKLGLARPLHKDGHCNSRSASVSPVCLSVYIKLSRKTMLQNEIKWN